MQPWRQAPPVGPPSAAPAACAPPALPACAVGHSEAPGRQRCAVDARHWPTLASCKLFSRRSEGVSKGCGPRRELSARSATGNGAVELPGQVRGLCCSSSAGRLQPQCRYQQTLVCKEKMRLSNVVNPSILPCTPRKSASERMEQLEREVEERPVFFNASASCDLTPMSSLA